jgi:tetratricopeptide (TPR) repeat protein
MRRTLSWLALLLCAAGCGTGGNKKMPPSELYLTERMATVLLQQGNPADAEVSFRKAIPQDPENPEMRDGHGLALLMLGRAKEALGEFDKALQISVRGAYLNNRGAAKMALGDLPGAEADFQKAYDSPLPADKESALINLGRARMRRGLYTESQEALTRAITLNPESFDALMARGECREMLQDQRGAVSDYLVALRLKKDNLSAMFRVGVGLIALKQDELGRKYLQRITEIAPDAPEAARARVLLGQERSMELSH